VSCCWACNRRKAGLAALTFPRRPNSNRARRWTYVTWFEFDADLDRELWLPVVVAGGAAVSPASTRATNGNRRRRSVAYASSRATKILIRKSRFAESRSESDRGAGLMYRVRRYL
jgi:hypothetical protein